MAVAFENCDVVLSEERAQHINEGDVRLDVNTEASKFKQNFHLASCLARLTKMTWEERRDYEIIEEGFKQAHGQYYMYAFTLPKVIGTDPWGFPSTKILYTFPGDPRGTTDSTSSQLIHTPRVIIFFSNSGSMDILCRLFYKKQKAPLGATTCIKVNDQQYFSLALLIQSPKIID